MQERLDQMCRLVLRHATGVRMDTPLRGVGIGVVASATTPVALACRAGICLVLQGAKQMNVGARRLRYAAGDYFTSVVEYPVTRSLVETHPGTPYVATSLIVDPDAISTLLAELGPAKQAHRLPAFAVATASPDVLDAWSRLLSLLDHPNDIPVLAPSRERELLYRLLQSEHGPLLRQLARCEGRLADIRRAIEWMQLHVGEPVPIKRLADMVGMSLPSFNRNFREATATSPLQYQKMLRLQAARRLLAVKAKVADAAFSVGYESPSQFSRDYSRHFGTSPKQDAVSMQNGLAPASELLI
ncbi:AraC family transcriptional regulator [Chitinasiproducens palmae]|uniref:Helix-turn-helix domain-containing protein n=1 Tax=Chitinasiproducens palmae TaxID=1770053 RepID=A0A1H2PLV5_9BURK|nr:AraC family transcriptional regulator [Chitinasiproducens palmae]SDV47364.1 Helix-turn-helix domain-containing protein [Chitinasiproducens palmae]